MQNMHTMQDMQYIHYMYNMYNMLYMHDMYNMLNMHDMQNMLICIIWTPLFYMPNMFNMSKNMHYKDTPPFWF